MEETPQSWREYVRSLKQRIIQLEAGKCQRCILGSQNDCERCRNKIIRKMSPVVPTPVGYHGLKEFIEKEIGLRYPTVMDILTGKVEQ